jgi:diguanylate cyclase (GGDEF)-like protein
MSLGNENTGLVRITISIGVACASGTALTASTTALVDMADRALYQAKRSGRNQVAAATP